MLLFKDQLGRFYTNVNYCKNFDEDFETKQIQFDHEDYRIEASDLIAIIPGSIKLGELDIELQSQGLISQIFAPASYTLSQILAEAWGHNLHKHILGLGVIDIDGTKTKTGSKVIKNVSGYDLSKIYIGSFNSLAIITSVNLRLDKCPEEELLIELDLPLFDLHKTITEKSIDFYYQLEAMFFDDWMDLKIIFANRKARLQIKSASNKNLLTIRLRKILKLIRDFSLSLGLESGFEKQIKTSFSSFVKNYINENKFYEIHAKVNDLHKIFLELVFQNPQYQIYLDPFDSCICVQADEAPIVSSPHHILIYPVNFYSRQIEKACQRNVFENNIIRKLKELYDPQNILNPGILC